MRTLNRTIITTLATFCLCSAAAAQTHESPPQPVLGAAHTSGPGETIRDTAQVAQDNAAQVTHHAGNEIDRAGAIVRDTAQVVEKNAREMASHAGKKIGEAGESVRDTSMTAEKNAKEIIK